MNDPALNERWDEAQATLYLTASNAARVLETVAHDIERIACPTALRGLRETAKSLRDAIRGVEEVARTMREQERKGTTI